MSGTGDARGDHRWRKSTASGSGNCVEVRVSGSSIVVRDSKSPAGPVLSFTADEWRAFVVGVRDGEFELEALRAP
jgi:predicted secreted Zn-dependent protease